MKKVLWWLGLAWLKAEVEVLGRETTPLLVIKCDDAGCSPLLISQAVLDAFLCIGHLIALFWHPLLFFFRLYHF